MSSLWFCMDCGSFSWVKLWIVTGLKHTDGKINYKWKNSSQFIYWFRFVIFSLYCEKSMYRLCSAIYWLNSRFFAFLPFECDECAVLLNHIRYKPNHNCVGPVNFWRPKTLKSRRCLLGLLNRRSLGKMRERERYLILPVESPCLVMSLTSECKHNRLHGPLYKWSNVLQPYRALHSLSQKLW